MIPLVTHPAQLPAIALAGALLALVPERRRPAAWVGPVLAAAACALALARPVAAGGAEAPLVAALVIAALARERGDPLPAECALKLVWVLGGAFALTAVGLALLSTATGVTAPLEQWSVLQLGLTPALVWAVALPLALLSGLVLLGGAPFHFWVADLFQGAPAAVAPLAVAAFQALGAMALSRRLEGIEAFEGGAALAGAVLRTAAVAAFLAGAGTLAGQRRPERRVGTLASLQGGIALAVLAAGEPGAAFRAWLLPWSAHLALALTGAALLARLTPSGTDDLAPGGPAFRRHPLAALAGLYATFSLAGVPGTPGATFWLDAARALAGAGRTGLLAALGLAWLVALTVAVRTLRVGFGQATGQVPGAPTPLPLRAGLWLTGGGLLALLVSRWARA